MNHFSLAADTDISPESYPGLRLLMLHSGRAELFGPDIRPVPLGPGDAVAAPCDTPVGIRAFADTVYTEITFRRDQPMNAAIHPGEIFTLASLLPTQEGRIVNMDITHNDTMKMALMSFAPGTGLTDHAAPGQALIIALEGEGIIRYEGQEYPIRAGESFSFAKGGMHAVRAEKPFKMALILMLQEA